jgi:hypothetical protein
LGVSVVSTVLLTLLSRLRCSTYWSHY